MGSNKSKPEQEMEKNDSQNGAVAQNGDEKHVPPTDDKTDFELKELLQTKLGQTIASELLAIAKANDLEHRALVSILSRGGQISSDTVREILDSHHSKNMDAVINIVMKHPDIDPNLYASWMAQKQQTMERQQTSSMPYSTPQYGVQSQRTGASYHYCNYYPYPRL